MSLLRIFLILSLAILTACSGGAPNGNDRDKDGVANGADAFPDDPSETTDTDNDGIGNNADSDDDGDGVVDDDDDFPLDATETTDTDGDGVGNNTDSDDDGDGVADADDAFPLDSTETTDTDGDGVGNNTDSDDDDDGVPDVDDGFPLDSTMVGVVIRGEISQTTWTQNTPYVFRDDAFIAGGAALTVDPGVEIHGHEFSLRVDGSLTLSGEPESQIVVYDLSIEPGNTSEDASHSVSISNAILSKGTLFSQQRDGGGLTLVDSIIIEADPIIVNDPIYTSDIERNVFVRSGGLSLSAKDGADINVVGNVFFEQTSAYAVNLLGADNASVAVENNSFLSKDNIAIRFNGNQDDNLFNAQFNYWNTIDPSKIETMIFDGLDSNEDHRVVFEPYLFTPHDEVAQTLGITQIPDADGDGAPDIADAFVDDPTEYLDTDGDGLGNNADNDDDGDELLDTDDAFPLDADESLDTDSDGVGNNADTDDDGDGVADADDALPLDAAETTDTDGDGIGNNTDTDDDNDGVVDTDDAFPLDADESLDTDGDGIGNNTDTDDDNDGVVDTDDVFPLDAGETLDTDGDGVGNNTDTDDDGDGVLDTDDAFPLDADESLDTDSDGVGNNADTDDDGDGVADADDAFPLDAGETLDTDGDGIGNNTDTDDDGDGITDDNDSTPLGGEPVSPVAVITVSSLTGKAPIEVTFSASDSLAVNPDTTDSSMSYSWSLGDGASSSEETFQHIYYKSGTFDVALTITNSEGISNTAATVVSLDAADESLSISGSIQIPEHYSVDSDVNDSGSFPVSNDEVPQFLYNPSITSGYANLPGTGPDFDGAGWSAIAGDVVDIYEFNARGGEYINLTVSAPDDADLDLFLYRPDGSEYSFSAGLTQYESLLLPDEPGKWSVKIVPARGASSYLLDIGSTSGLASHGWTSNADLSYKELIATDSSKNALLSKKAASHLRFVEEVKMPNDNYSRSTLLVMSDQGLDLMSAHPVLAGWSNSNRNRNDSKSIKMKKSLETFLAAKSVKSSGVYDFVEPNFVHSIMTTPDDLRYHEQWALEKLSLPEAWNSNTGTGTVNVAILDTGIFKSHPDLQGRLSTDSYDFVSNATNSGDGDGVDSDSSDPGDGPGNQFCPQTPRQFSSFHGTQVAGVIGAVGNNGIGMSGVSWNVNLMDVRVLGCLGGTTQDIVDGILYSAKLPNRWGVLPLKKADVINLSFGSQGYSQLMADAISAARAEGVVVVGAAGNTGNDDNAIMYPASYEGVISVGATDASDVVASYSTTNIMVDIVAPGGTNTSGIDKILSTGALINEDSVTTPTYTYQVGTSMSAPFVTGIVALMKDTYPNLSPDDVDLALSNDRLTVDLGLLGKDNQYGYGRIDAAKSIQHALELLVGSNDPFPPKLASSKTLLRLGYNKNVDSFLLFNRGDGTLLVSDIQTNDDALSVTLPETEDGLGDYQINLDRTNLSEGSYASSINITSDVGDLLINIHYEVLPVGVSPDANSGEIYSILFDTDTLQMAAITQSSAVNGQYDLEISDIPAGVYYLISGSDSDNDGFVCGNTEACAVYGDQDQANYLIVNDNMTDLQLNSYFRVSPKAQPSSVGPVSAPHVNYVEAPCGIKGQSESGEVCLSDQLKRTLTNTVKD
jgi:subtilisin family serine protease